MEKKAPYFSVIIPTKDRPEMAERAIRSVLMQNADFEIIVVNDGGSKDIELFLNNLDDKRIKYFYQTNKGRSRARNFGLERVSGAFVIFLDDDDYFLENYLKVVTVAIIQKPGYIIKTGAFWKIGNELIPEEQLGINDANNIFELIYLKSLSSGQVILPRESFNGNIFKKEYSFGEDLDFFLNVLIKHSLIYEISERVVVFDDHEGRSVKNMEKNEILNEYRILRKISKDLRNENHKLKISKKVFLIRGYKDNVKAFKKLFRTNSMLSIPYLFRAAIYRLLIIVY